MSTWNKHYHWKTKGCTPWAKEWLREHLVDQSVALSSKASVKVDDLSAFDGDVELGNRKGKLITIYDCSVTLTWSGEAEDGTAANGTLKFLEFSHEIEDNDETYPFETELLSESSAQARELYAGVRSKLAPQLEKILHGFRTELIESHAKDLGHEGEGASSATGTKVAQAPAAQAPVSTSSKKDGPVSTSTAEVRVASHLAISQADLWELLTNPHRIPMWSKAPAQFSPNPGANFSLFGGNITGSIVEVSAPHTLVQTWRVPQWPSGHFGRLTTKMTQGDDSTQLELVLAGIPSGQEDQAEAGLEAYYIRGLKSMGYVDVTDSSLGTIL